MGSKIKREEWNYRVPNTLFDQFYCRAKKDKVTAEEGSGIRGEFLTTFIIMKILWTKKTWRNRTNTHKPSMCIQQLSTFCQKHTIRNKGGNPRGGETDDEDGEYSKAVRGREKVRELMYTWSRQLWSRRQKPLAWRPVGGRTPQRALLLFIETASKVISCLFLEVWGDRRSNNVQQREREWMTKHSPTWACSQHWTSWGTTGRNG